MHSWGVLLVVNNFTILIVDARELRTSRSLDRKVECHRVIRAKEVIVNTEQFMERWDPVRDVTELRGRLEGVIFIEERGYQALTEF